jgi:cytoskeletal protein RodZ
MLTVGQEIKAARKARKLTLEEICQRTNIGVRYLEAIEADDLKVLPGGVFYRAWIRQISEIVGLDPEKLKPLMPTSPEYSLPLSTEMPLPRSSGGRLGEPLAELSRQPILQPLILLVVLAVAALAFHWWSNRGSEPAPIAQQAPATVATPVSSTPVDADSSSPLPGQVDRPMTSLDLPAGTLQLVATDQVWIQIGSAGQILFSGVMAAGERKSLNIEQARIKIGNAAGLEVVWKGKPFGTLGDRGQVRELEVTPERWQFIAVPAAPKDVAQPTGI